MRDFRAIGAEGVADRIGGVVRDREGIDFDVADFEALARANIFHAIDLGFAAGFAARLAVGPALPGGGLFGILGRKHFHDFAVRRLGEVRGAIPFAGHLREAGGMVGMLVGDQDRVHALGTRAAQRLEAAQHFLFAKPGVDEEGGAAGFEQRRVARAAGSENGDPERDAVALSPAESGDVLHLGRARRQGQRKNAKDGCKEAEKQEAGRTARDFLCALCVSAVSLLRFLGVFSLAGDGDRI